MEVKNLSDPAAEPESILVGIFDENTSYAIRRPGGASSWLLTWTMAGGGRLCQGDTKIRAQPGDLVILGPQITHHYGTDPDVGRWKFGWAHFQPRGPWLTWLHPFRRPGRVYRVSVSLEAMRQRVSAVFHQLHADAQWSGEAEPPASVAENTPTARIVAAVTPAARELTLGGLETILVLAALTGTGDDGSLDERVRRAQWLIDADPAADHTVAALAAQVALSPSRFAHLFAAQTGRSPMQAVCQARLTHAARLLDTTELDVAQVAAASGFADAFHFSRQFRHHTGLSPRAYRRRLRQRNGRQ